MKMTPANPAPAFFAEARRSFHAALKESLSANWKKSSKKNN